MKTMMLRYPFQSTCLILVTLGLLVAPQSYATDSVPQKRDETTVCKRQVCFPKLIKVNDQELEIQGVADFTYLVFKLYTAALYTALPVSTTAQALADTPKLLVIHYHRNIGAKDFIRSADATLKKNPEVDVTRYREELAKINSWYQDVSKNDRYQLFYSPKNGTSLIFNDDWVGTIPGSSFAKSYLGIWLSDYSLNRDFTRRLLRPYRGS